MQAPQGPQRSSQRRSPANDGVHPPTQHISTRESVTNTGPRSSSGSSKSVSSRSVNNPEKQISQIEKSVTHLLVATKQLLETLTQWSRKHATEGEVSDVYVRLGYEFNLACRAFSAIGVDTSDLGPVPDLLRAILEDTLSQDASPQSLDKYLPRIRDIIINLLHGLKRKQAKLRNRQARDGRSGSSSQPSRQMSGGSVPGPDGSSVPVIDDASPDGPARRPPPSRYDSTGSLEDQGVVPPRTSSVGGASERPSTADREMHQRDPQTTMVSCVSSSSMSSATMQNLPVLPPYSEPPTIRQPSPEAASAPYPPPPPPPPKQQDALAALQRGGELERRASRRFSQFQISKLVGSSPNGVPVLPPTQNSPIPNRGRDVRESMNAVRLRGSYQAHGRQRSNNRVTEISPNRSQVQRISEEGVEGIGLPKLHPPPESTSDDSPTTKTPEDKYGPPLESPEGPSATLRGPPPLPGETFPGYDVQKTDRDGDREPSKTERDTTSVSTLRQEAIKPETAPHTTQFVPEESPPPGKELTLFLQYKSKIKKYILPEGYQDLTLARLQLAFIEKFNWNTQSSGMELPEIYVQDPVSGVRHELEDLNDVKDRSVLVLNVEVLDEVRRHFDEGLGGVRKMLEEVRSTVDTHGALVQRVSDRQLDTSKDMARLAANPSPAATAASKTIAEARGLRSSGSTSSVTSNSASEVQGFRRELAVLRQSFSSLSTDLASSVSNLKSKGANVKALAQEVTIPTFTGDSGRAHLNAEKKSLADNSEALVNRVDDLQDIVEDLRKDVVQRGVRPRPRQLETVSKDISAVTKGLKKMQEFIKREKPIWTKIWEKELNRVMQEREELTQQEELTLDLEDDLEKATQVFALVEQATKQQNLQSGPVSASGLRNTSRNMADNTNVDPHEAKDGVLGEVRALQPNHETRLEAIERAEKMRQKELESRKDNEFQREVANFVEEGKLKKTGGAEEVERLRKAKDERIRKEVWERQQARAAEMAEREAAEAAAAAATATNDQADPKASDDGERLATYNGEPGPAEENVDPAASRHQDQEPTEDKTISAAPGEPDTADKADEDEDKLDSPKSATGLKGRSSWLPAIFSSGS